MLRQLLKVSAIIATACYGVQLESSAESSAESTAEYASWEAQMLALVTDIKENVESM